MTSTACIFRSHYGICAAIRASSPAQKNHYQFRTQRIGILCGLHGMQNSILAFSWPMPRSLPSGQAGRQQPSGTFDISVSMAFAAACIAALVITHHSHRMVLNGQPRRGRGRGGGPLALRYCTTNRGGLGTGQQQQPHGSCLFRGDDTAARPALVCLNECWGYGQLLMPRQACLCGPVVLHSVPMTATIEYKKNCCSMTIPGSARRLQFWLSQGFSQSWSILLTQRDV